jgi:hypothetical protein
MSIEPTFERVGDDRLMADPLSERPIHCRTWDALVQQLNSLSGWLLRGQREESWSLITSLERHAPDDRTKSDAERHWRRDFERRAHFYLDPQHIPTDKLEWLALMQHFGAPTRLLDVTRSPYVAAYFAVEDKGSEENCAVWAVDEMWCAEAAGRVLVADTDNDPIVKSVKASVGGDPQRLALGVSYAIAGNAPAFAGRVLNAHPSLVIPAEPKRLSERLSIQQGTFLCLGNPDRSFVENFTAMDGWRDKVRKYTFPFSERRRALEELRKMNITRASLFPGLDGFAQSFRNSLLREPSEQRNIRLAVQGLVDLAARASEQVRVADEQSKDES